MSFEFLSIDKLCLWSDKAKYTQKVKEVINCSITNEIPAIRKCYDGRKRKYTKVISKIKIETFQVEK